MKPPRSCAKVHLNHGDSNCKSSSSTLKPQEATDNSSLPLPGSLPTAEKSGEALRTLKAWAAKTEQQLPHNRQHLQHSLGKETGPHHCGQLNTEPCTMALSAAPSQERCHQFQDCHFTQEMAEPLLVSHSGETIVTAVKTAGASPSQKVMESESDTSTDSSSESDTLPQPMQLDMDMLLKA